MSVVVSLILWTKQLWDGLEFHLLFCVSSSFDLGLLIGGEREVHTLETDLVYVRFLVTRLGSEKHTFEVFPHIRHLQSQREGKLHTSIGIGIDGQRSRSSRSSLYEHTGLGSSSSVCLNTLWIGWWAGWRRVSKRPRSPPQCLLAHGLSTHED